MAEIGSNAETFLFTSESVGEGHAGENLVCLAGRVLIKQLSL